ncbi:protein MOS2-like protein [Carex littledalei]|uniref:Protein MOS2-like protein n=1 Tax=Carex littledalei TaxID=544730 RepID=A0A833QT83_9POAL|nr:protein MOS2-like protein [Carex littledalei]
MKLSFAINSSKSKPTSRPKPASGEPDADDPEAASTSVAQFVTEFDPTKPLSSKPEKAVIAPIPNSDYIRRFKPTLPLPSAEDDPSQFCTEANFVLDTNSSADPSGLPYGLSIRSYKENEDAGGMEENWRARKREEGPENRILKRYKEDMLTLPDEGGPDEFKGTELGELAAALLRGYGWTEGKVLGRNKNREDTKIVDFQKRSGSYGLGFNPSTADPKKNRSGDWILPDSGAQEKRDKDNGKEREAERNSSRREEDLPRERIGSRQRKVENGDVRDERVGSRRKDEVERERNDSTRRREKDEERDGGSSRKKERESKREEHKETKVVRWLTSHIRVRIISKDFKKGRYYLKKGEVVDVVGPTTCDISMDGTRELLQGVEQGMLETALPKKGGAVLVLYGKHKGIYGNLVEKDLEEETGVIRDADSHELVNVQLEQIAEYLGDPAYLGY